MDALTPDERARRQQVLAILRERMTAVEHEPEGMAFRLRNERETFALAGEFVVYEARCCPFLRFDLAVEDGGDTVRLRMSGDEGVGDFLRATFGGSEESPRTPGR
jgi:hypothetical protein